MLIGGALRSPALFVGRRGLVRGSEQRSLTRAGWLSPQAPEDPRRFREGRPVEPFVSTSRAARRHDDVATLSPHVQARPQPTGAVPHLLSRRVPEEDVHPAAARAGPRRLGERAGRALQFGEALRAAVPRVHVQYQQAATLSCGDADVGPRPAAPPDPYAARIRGGVPETVVGERHLAARLAGEHGDAVTGVGQRRPEQHGVRSASPPRPLYAPPSRMSRASSRAPCRMSRTSTRAVSRRSLTPGRSSSSQPSASASSARPVTSMASHCASIRRSTALRKRPDSPLMSGFPPRSPRRPAGSAPRPRGPRASPPPARGRGPLAGNRPAPAPWRPLRRTAAAPPGRRAGAL